ncbi:MAG: hypothetical protein ACYTGN_12705 [Planctomycetota bacterium]
MLERAATFLSGHARVLEWRLFEVAFQGGDPAAVRHALEAYRNADGGFGHALEPDARVPTSQPLFAHFALTAMREAGLPGGEGVAAYLASVARDDGALPYLLPDAMEHPRAGHWNGDFALAPSLHATAGVLGGLHALGVRNDDWVTRATTWCIERIWDGPRYSGQTILNILDMLLHLPRPVDSIVKAVTDHLFESDYVLMETPITTYGLTPLRFAPAPDHPLRPLFPDEAIERHLDDLVSRQEDDGGWPLHWTPPDGAARDAWRGRWTLDALRTLRAYGRI